MNSKCSLVDKCFRNEVIFGDVVAKFMQAARLVEHMLAHQTRHAGHAVDAYQVDEQVHAAMRGTEVDLLEDARKAWTLARVRHLMNQTHFFRH